MICLMFFHSIGSLKKSDPFLTELERLILTLQLVMNFFSLIFSELMYSFTSKYPTI